MRSASLLSQPLIDQAKSQTRYGLGEPRHEHDDCIRIAYEWLDAQRKISGPNTRTTRPLKHIVEAWAGRYVCQSDVEVAAQLHPEITGRYPHFNVSSRLTRPNIRRLDGIGEAFKHSGYCDRYQDSYSITE